MVKLGVNIDHVATLRQQRRETDPDVVAAAKVCEKAGADGITVHLREDRRHIQDEDVRRLRAALSVRLNLEMAVTDEMVAIACGVKPGEVCLVPEKRQELTTEGGLDVEAQYETIAAAVAKLKAAGIAVNIFVDPEEDQIEAAHRAGADGVELHTGSYARRFSDPQTCARELGRLEHAGRVAVRRGLVLNAGHGLTVQNVGPVARMPGMHELNIGFSIIARAIFVGLDPAVREMIEAIRI